jgi:hypothetical protein
MCMHCDINLLHTIIAASSADSSQGHILGIPPAMLFWECHVHIAMPSSLLRIVNVCFESASVHRWFAGETVRF